MKSRTMHKHSSYWRRTLAALILTVLTMNSLITPAAAVNARLNLPQGQRIIPIENNRLLFPEAFLECAAVSRGAGVTLQPVSGGTIAGATFTLVANDASRCGGMGANCLIANNPNPSTTTGVTVLRLQCSDIVSPFLQFMTPTSGGSKLLCRPATVYSYAVTAADQPNTPDYVSFRFPSDDADALDISSLTIVDSESAILLRANNLETYANDPYLYYCPDPSVMSTSTSSTGSGGAFLKSHQQTLISSGSCISFHSPITRAQYTHLHGVFLMKRTSLNFALSGATEGIIVTYQAKDSWGATCKGQLQFLVARTEALTIASLPSPPVATMFVPSSAASTPQPQPALLSDGTYGIIASSGKVSFALSHAAGTSGPSAVPASAILYQITPIDMSPNCLTVCYSNDPAESSCFSSSWPQTSFSMSQEDGDGMPLFLTLEAQPSFGACMGTVEIRRVAVTGVGTQPLGMSEPLFLTVSVLKVSPSATSQSDPTILGDGSSSRSFRLMDLLGLQGVQSPLFDTSTPARRGGWEEFLFSPLVSKSNVADAPTSSRLLGPTQISVTSAAGTSCTISAGGSPASAGPITVTDAAQVVSIRATGSTPCTLGIAPSASSQSAPVSVALGSSLQATSPTTSTSGPPSTQAGSTTTPPIVQNTAGPDDGSSSTASTTIIIIVVAVVAVLLVIIGCVLFCCRDRIRACCRGRRRGTAKSASPRMAGVGKNNGFGGYHSDEEDNPAASLRGYPNRARMQFVHDDDEDIHPTDMPGSPTLIAASPRTRATGTHFSVNVPGAKVVDEDDWDDHTHQSASPNGIGMVQFARQTTYGSPHSPKPRHRVQHGAASPEAVLASALSNSLSLSHHASPYNQNLRVQRQRNALGNEFEYMSPIMSRNNVFDNSFLSGSQHGSPIGAPIGGRRRLANSGVMGAGSPLGAALGPGSPGGRNPRRFNVVSPTMLDGGQTTYTHAQRPDDGSQYAASPLHDRNPPAPGGKRPLVVASPVEIAVSPHHYDLNATAAPNRTPQHTAVMMNTTANYPFPTSPVSPSYQHLAQSSVGQASDYAINENASPKQKALRSQFLAHQQQLHQSYLEQQEALQEEEDFEAFKASRRQRPGVQPDQRTTTNQQGPSGLVDDFSPPNGSTVKR